MKTYMDRIHAVLDEQQSKRFEQLIFRLYWFSENAMHALVRSGVDLTDTQKEQVDDLVSRYQLAVNESRNRSRNLFRNLRGGGSLIHDSDSYLVEFAKEFPAVLVQIVGKERKRTTC